MENSPKIGVKGFIYRMLDAGQRIIEMQIAGGGLAVLFPGGPARLSPDELIFVAFVASVFLVAVIQVKGELE